MNKQSRLLIHVGVPKTATTTLQDGLFVSLNKQNQINYFGKTSECRSDKYHKVVKTLLFNRDKEKVTLTKNLLNVFSEEWLTSNPFNLKERFDIEVDSLNIPKELANYFDEVQCDVDVLIVIRNQQTRIYSHYLEAYDYLHKNKNHQTWETHLKTVLSNDNDFITYDYDQLINAYVSVFGDKHVHVLFYEDFINDKLRFYQELSEVMNIEASLLESLMVNTHLNKKEKDESGTKIEVRKLSKSKRLLYKITHSKLIEPFYKKVRNTIILKKLKGNSLEEVLIEHQSIDQCALIYEKYKESNMKLSKKYNIDKRKLIRYNYY